MEKFRRPKFIIKEESEDKNFCTVEVSPLERGFGTTIGNSLRRVLLSSIPGLSVYGIKVNGITHEFAKIPGVKEDMPTIILNLKKLAIKSEDYTNLSTSEKIILKINGGTGEIKAKDIICPAGISIENKDLVLANALTTDAFQAELFVRAGKGFTSFNFNKEKGQGLVGFIATDSNFSPIINTSVHVEPTNLGREKDLEKLEIKIQTNGCLTAKEAVAIASKILMDHLNEFLSWSNRAEELEVIDDFKEETTKENLKLSIVELDLSVRALNSLKRHGIEKVEEITSMTRQEVMAIKNMGKKSVDEIAEKLQEHSFTFKNEK